MKIEGLTGEQVLQISELVPEAKLREVSTTAYCGGSWNCYDSHDYLDEYIEIHGIGFEESEGKGS